MHARAADRVVLAKCGVMDDVAGNAVVVRHDCSEELRDAPVQQLAARVRDARVGGLPHQVMREIVGIGPERLDDAAALQLLEDRKQLDRVERRDPGQRIEREASSQRRRPGQQLTAALLQPCQLPGDDRFDAVAAIRLAPRPGTGQLQDEQGIALAFGG